MMDDTRKRLSQLVEINRALARDLDASQRAAAEAGRERDCLRAQVESLQDQISGLASLDITRELKSEIGKIRRELVQSRRSLDQIRRERDAMLRDIQAAKARADLAEQKRRVAEYQLRQVEQERDRLEQQLEESFSAMDEIRRRLAMSVEEIPVGDGLN